MFHTKTYEWFKNHINNDSKSRTVLEVTAICTRPIVLCLFQCL
jgi:hypothetical protein